MAVAGKNFIQLWKWTIQFITLLKIPTSGIKASLGLAAVWNILDSVILLNKFSPIQILDDSDKFLFKFTNSRHNIRLWKTCKLIFRDLKISEDWKIPSYKKAHLLRTSVTAPRPAGLHPLNRGQSPDLALFSHAQFHKDLQHITFNNYFLKIQKANQRKPSVIHYIHQACVNHCHPKFLYSYTAGISTCKSLSSALIITMLCIICWPRKTPSFTVWIQTNQESPLFPLSRTSSCCSLLLTLPNVFSITCMLREGKGAAHSYSKASQ